MDILVANGSMFQLEYAKLASDMDLVPIDQYPPLTVANSINRHQLRVVAIGQFSSSENLKSNSFRAHLWSTHRKQRPRRDVTSSSSFPF